MAKEDEGEFARQKKSPENLSGEYVIMLNSQGPKPETNAAFLSKDKKIIYCESRVGRVLILLLLLHSPWNYNTFDDAQSQWKWLFILFNKLHLLCKYPHRITRNNVFRISRYPLIQ